jgi:hypothetical protein
MICHCGRILAALLALVSLVKPATGQTLAGVRHWSGQGVAPVYEGWDRNPDGSYNMWFGYMNRNFEETLDVPIGADNRFEPGSPDRGQPTFFDTRRHKDVFRVVVPAEFAPTAKLTWSITIRGTTETVGATLNPVWQIDRLRTTRGGNIDRIDSNTPPTATASASTRTVVVDTPIALEVVAADDGNPKRRGETIGMTVEWSKYRGPGQVTLTPAKQPVTGGKARATATFSEPGQYTLLAVVDDGSGESAGNFGYHCCWTNVQVQVVVEGKTSAPALTRTGASAPLTFARDVAPIFRAKCVQCHHEGTGAPMSLITHEQVRPWARSIRQRRTVRCRPGISTRPLASGSTRTISR